MDRRQIMTSQILILASVIRWHAAPAGYCEDCGRRVRSRSILQPYGDSIPDKYLRFSTLSGGHTRAESAMVDNFFRAQMERQLTGRFHLQPRKYLCQACAIRICVEFHRLSSRADPITQVAHALQASFTALLMGCETGFGGQIRHISTSGVGIMPRPEIVLAGVLALQEQAAA
jgi:hypothetical protein